MQNAAQISARLNELIQQGERVVATRTHGSHFGSTVTVLGPDRVDCALAEQWVTSTLGFIQRVFGRESVYCKRFAAYTGRSGTHEGAKQLVAVLTAVKTSYEAGDLLATFSSKTEGSAETLRVVCQICWRFHLVVRQLQSRYASRKPFAVRDEYDVQDLLHALLHVNFDDIRIEEWTPSYAGGASRVDFLLKNEKVVVETKKTRKGLAGKAIGDQLLVDIGRYEQHPDCKCLVCFVYDPDGEIRNPTGIENDLSKDHGQLKVMVIIAPKGK
jgi:hypothetical protein